MDIKLHTIEHFGARAKLFESKKNTKCVIRILIIVLYENSCSNSLEYD